MSAHDGKPTMEEVGESLTGYDEIAIEKAFKVPGVDSLTGTRPARAMAFVLLKRQGKTDAEAYESSMSLPLSGVMGLFDIEELDDRNPMVEETEPGKGGGPSGTGRMSSLPSAC